LFWTRKLSLLAAAEKSEAIAMCKEKPDIPVDKAVDKKRICNWKKWAEEDERHRGSRPPQK
jgi:hypothetical protein